jgi:chromosome partitioning protein
VQGAPRLRVVEGTVAAPSRRDVASDGEHPSVILKELMARPRPRSHIIVFANEKGGVGKSTLAFHSCVALADQGLRVAAIDLDRRQQSLARALSHRNGTARRLGIALPGANHAVLEQPSSAMLIQEIARVGWDADFVVIDAPGHDCPIARRAIAMADTLVTPVNNSFVDLDLLGRFDPVTRRYRENGFFSRVVNELSEERQLNRLARIDWIVAPNRVRRAASQNREQIESALRRLAPHAGFRIGHGLSERESYRDIALLGLTQLDTKRVPQLGRVRAQTRSEILALIEDLALPQREDAVFAL